MQSAISITFFKVSETFFLKSALFFQIDIAETIPEYDYFKVMTRVIKSISDSSFDGHQRFLF